MYVAKPPNHANGTIPPHRGGPAARRWLAGAAVLIAAGCSTTGSQPQPLSPTTYPDLASVPPRPVLPDTLAQRHAIQAQLVAARANAEFRAAELAYATGRAAEPPRRPEPPPAGPAVAGPARPRTGGDGTVARAYLDSSLNDIRDRGKLRQFMRRLGREAPDPFGPQTLAQALGIAAVPPPPPDPASRPARAPSANPEPGTPEFFGDVIDGGLGFGGDDPAQTPD